MGEHLVSRGFMRVRMCAALGLILLSALAAQQLGRLLIAEVQDKAAVAAALDDAQSAISSQMLGFLELSLAQDEASAELVRAELRRAARIMEESRAVIAAAAAGDGLGRSTAALVADPALDPLGGLAQLDEITSMLSREGAPFAGAAARATGVGLDVARRLAPLVQRMKETERAAAAAAASSLSRGGLVALGATLAATLATAIFIFLPLERRILRVQTDLEAERDAAERASRAKTEFLATMSHEIRTPMNGVLGMAELLRESGLSPKQSSMVEVLVNSGAALMRVIDAALDLARIESGRRRLVSETFDLRQLCEQATALFSGAAAAKGLTLTCRFFPELVSTRLGDSDAVRQALTNLIANAVKFTERGGVRVEAKGDAGRILLTVRDSGVGVPKEAQARIFESFEQADRSTTRRYGGSGLGLAIVRRLAEAMGGRVGVRSEPGVGSAFTLSLPLPEVPPAAAAAAEAKDEASLPPLRVLVAEDNDVNALVITTMLKRLGCRAERVEDGQAAAQRVEAEAFDVVLMDVSMPGMDGLEATRRIRAWETLGGRPAIPILGLSAHAMAEHREAAAQAGMSDFLTKPIALETLRRALRAASPAATPEEAMV